MNNIIQQKNDFSENIYNLSDLNWKDDTLENNIGDIDGSDPSMSGYNKGWQIDPYEQRYYAHIKRRGENVKRLKLSMKQIFDISATAENYANEILTLWTIVDGPLQNFFEAFTMNKIDNKTKKQIAESLNEKGYKVYPVLVDERVRHASTDFKEFTDFQLSDESLTAIENRLSGQADPFYKSKSQNGGPTIEIGFDETTQLNSDYGVPPTMYEIRLSRLKKNK